MTQEEKQLLIKDLRERLPYGVIYHRNDGANIELREVDIKNGTLNYTDNIVVRECKPYLRPMDSMTIVEKNLYDELYKRLGRGVSYEMFMDFIHTHHLDWFGFIEKGLALPAPFGMYKNEKHRI